MNAVTLYDIAYILLWQMLYYDLNGQSFSPYGAVSHHCHHWSMGTHITEVYYKNVNRTRLIIHANLHCISMSPTLPGYILNNVLLGNNNIMLCCVIPTGCMQIAPLRAVTYLIICRQGR